MKKELQEELFDIAPEFFDRGSPSESLMYFGFAVGDGWFPILKKGLKAIKKWTDGPNWSSEWPDKKYPYVFKVLQVKEKFGTLRFYAGGADRNVNAIIEGMEFASSCICERCGANGDLRTDMYWIRTLCDNCYDTFEDWRASYGAN